MRYRNIESLTKYIEKEIDSTQKRIEGWGAVEIKKKKDGSEFKKINNGMLEGCYLTSNTWYRDESEIKRLNLKVASDSFDVYGSCRDLPADDPRYSSRIDEYYTYSPTELREAVKKWIAYLEKYKKQRESQLEWLQRNGDDLMKAIDSLKSSYIDEATQLGISKIDLADITASRLIGWNF